MAKTQPKKRGLSTVAADLVKSDHVSKRERSKRTKKKATRKKAVTAPEGTAPTAGNQTAGSGQAHDIVDAMRGWASKHKYETDIVGGVLSEDTLPAVTEWLRSGIPTLDRLLGGGWAIGRISEVYGPEAAGKSAQGHLAAADATQSGGLVLHVDCERALDQARLRSSNIVADRMIYVTPNYVEQGAAMVFQFLDQIEKNPPPGPSLILWDSVPVCPSLAEWEAQIDDGKEVVAAQSRAYKKMLFKLYSRVARNRVHFMWINQERVDMTAKKKGFSGQVYKVPGPKEIKYMASQRVRCTPAFGHKRKVGTEVVGYTLRMTTEKARLTPPHRQVDWVLMFDGGPSVEWSLWEAFEICNVLKRSGGDRSQSYKVPWTNRTFTKKKWMDMMAEPDFRAKAIAAVDNLPVNTARAWKEHKDKGDSADL